MTIRQTGKSAAEMLLSGYVRGNLADSRGTFFEKWYANSIRVIHLEQAGDFSQPVEITAKVDLAGMDTDNLFFYSYDRESNSYRRISEPGYWTDSNGYLHFPTGTGGTVVVSEGALVKK